MVKKNKDILVTEAYRVLMSNIEYSSYDKPIKVIVVTSSQSGEGKTTIAKNLALTMAESSKKVVLVDCDMRRPNIHKKFKISNSTGLSEILTGQSNKIKDNYNINENIDIITSGKTPPNPVEMISSKKMDDFIELLRESYDYVILDAPPIMAVAECANISS
ncbi:CpsD/CapB family tyrosine-protein kinase [Clostridium celatum]|uniref:non-specific protein-tyrosine kinase n=1 Tax=Clostridium celatum DSM 1785 TaxID=545697 RepID=L1QM52_9CLOT|nr:CpsD/CapB family tyrosine-protein kinase [Clostridium celatum]EKY29069.1 capsular exopolysaccharide family protein [Clostridium celatum DSM 1785]